MRAAAELLLRKQVHGAPVVDEQGNCVGVLTTTDFLHWTKECRKRVSDANKNYFSPWQIVNPEDLPEEAVSNFMTTDSVAVAPSTSICQLAQKMVDGRIHRLLVVAEGRKPVGIISCTDILAAVARAEHYAE